MINIRQVTEADIPALAAVYVECMWAPDNNFTQRTAEALLAHFLQGPGRGVCCAALEDDRPVGGFFAKFRPWWDGIRVNEIEFFMQDKLRNGMASAKLIAFALHRAYNLGATVLEGLVFSDETSLLAMYAKGKVIADKSLVVINGNIREIMDNLKSSYIVNRGKYDSFGIMGKKDFYSSMHKSYADCVAGDRIWAIEMPRSDIWNDSEEEQRFIQDNIDAAERGVEITRVFVINAEDAEKFVINANLRRFANYPKINNFIVKQSDLPTEVLQHFSSGLGGINKTFLMLDLPESESARGYMTFDIKEIEQYRKYFDELVEQIKILQG
ncbi:hypothetical protein FACS18945_2220 [Bacteroidia bacterium]|nr:hypothetical protein FACS18945_2220 [Bacteroidia bacterium]